MPPVAHPRIVTAVSNVAARFPYLLVAGATAVVIGSGFTFAGLRGHADDVAVRDVAAPAAAPAPSVADTPDSPLLPTEAPPPPTTKPPASSSPAPKKPAPRKTTVRRPQPKPTRTTAAPRPQAPSTGDAVLDAVLGHINDARADEGLRALTLDAKLSQASALHNQEMIDGCGLSHRCSGEADLGPRFSAQGVQWRAAGENIGFGTAGSSRSAMIGAANGLTDSMLAEKPPEDGHRRNLLSTGFTRIGLSVVRADGKVWFTQDFVG